MPDGLLLTCFFSLAPLLSPLHTAELCKASTSSAAGYTDRAKLLLVHMDAASVHLGRAEQPQS